MSRFNLSSSAKPSPRTDSAAAVEVGASFLAVKWPTAENDFASMSFVLYVPNGEQGTMHTMHICGFLFPDECSNEIPFPGKEFGRCGASDVDRDRTGYFCDFVALHETVEDNGGVLMSGTESLERYEEHAERVGDARAGDVEIHFELIRLGDEGDVDVDEDEDLSPAPAPSPAPAREPKSSRRMLPVRGPSICGTSAEIEPTHAASSRPSICGTSDDYTSGAGSTQLRHASRLAKRSSVKSV